MRPLLTIITLALLGVAFGVQAQPQDHGTAYRYRWVDATGLPHYSDTLNIKAVQYGYEVLGADGRIVSRVAGAVAPNDHNAVAAKQAKHENLAQQQQRDRQLLMAYPSEADYKAVLEARVEQLDQHMHTTRMNLIAQEQNFAQLLDSAADYSRKGKPVPHALKQRLTKQRQTVDTQRQQLKQQQAQLAKTRKQISAELAHYRTLIAKQQARYGG